MNPYQLESIPYQYGVQAFPNTVPSYLNNGFGMVPRDPGNGKYDAAESLSSMFSMSNPLVGAGIGFLGNVMGKAIDSAMQIGNQKTLMDYQTQINSPQAMMARMQQAGINPAAAAQGISGAPAAGAASGGSAGIPTGTPNLIDTLAGSENTRLNGEMLKAMTSDYEASASLKSGQATDQWIKNKYVDKFYSQELRKLVADGYISENFAYMYSVDSKYHEAQAYANTMQLYQNLERGAQEIANLEQEYFNLLAQEALTMAQEGLTRAQISKCFADINLTNAEIQKVYHEIDNIDVNTMSQSQGISESKVRERLLRIQAQYEEKYYSIFDTLGFDPKSSIDNNLQMNIKSGNKAGAQEILNGLSAVIITQGNARFDSKDYNMDKAIELFGEGARLYGMQTMGKRSGGIPTKTSEYRGSVSNGYNVLY